MADRPEMTLDQARVPSDATVAEEVLAAELLAALKAWAAAPDDLGGEKEAAVDGTADMLARRDLVEIAGGFDLIEVARIMLAARPSSRAASPGQGATGSGNLMIAFDGDVCTIDWGWRTILKDWKIETECPVAEVEPTEPPQKPEDFIKRFEHDGSYSLKISGTVAADQAPDPD